MRPRIASLLVAPLLGLAACAKGASDVPGTGRDAGGPGRRDGGMRDAGRDTGPACMDEGNGSACETATDLGRLRPGDSLLSMTSVIPRVGSEDWFRVAFPRVVDAGTAPPEDAGLAGPSMAGVGELRIEFAMNEGNAFRFEVRSGCAAPLGCGEEMTAARDLQQWTFRDDPAASAEGEGRFTTRNVPWPEMILIRVYRASGATADCARFQLRVARSAS
ncbi:MAG: hypothetical protein RMK74_05580 [Myxococcales bacterium]|nr:hypothetical protein [Myxococcales bacterium]